MLQQHHNHMRTLFLVFAVFATIVNAGIFTPKVALKCPATGEDATQNEVANPCQPGGIYNTNTALFSGTYVCRQDSYLVFWSRNTTVCIPTLTGAAIAEEGDKCGCCDEAGNTVECPPPCSCICSHDDNPHVLLYKTGAFGQKDTECMSKSKASRFVVDIRKGDYRYAHRHKPKFCLSSSHLIELRTFL